MSKSGWYGSTKPLPPLRHHIQGGRDVSILVHPAEHVRYHRCVTDEFYNLPEISGFEWLCEFIFHNKRLKAYNKCRTAMWVEEPHEKLRRQITELRDI